MPPIRVMPQLRCITHNAVAGDKLASSKWKNWQELGERTDSRQLVFWGASNWVERTLQATSLSAAFIVDNNPNNQGIEYAGLPVHAPGKLTQAEASQFYIIICTANYPSVIDELDAMGFVMGDDYCVTPLLNQRKAKDDLKTVDTTLLVSSPQHLFSAQRGGGVYECHTGSAEVHKRYTGKVRGMAQCDDGLLVVDMLKGLVLLDADFNQLETLSLAGNSEAHGLFYDAATDRVYVGQPGRDSIAIYSLKDRKLIDELFISDKWARNKKDNHHVNDVYVLGDSLYVSLFSFSGNWMNEVYDGGVLEIDLRNGKILGPVVTDLWMPHSISRFNGRLCYVDSMRGELFDRSYRRAGHFYSFIRGLDYDGQYFYVGSTEHRYPEKLDSDQISLDTGFYIFDPRSKMSRFFAMPQIEAVHSILLRT